MEDKKMEEIVNFYKDMGFQIVPMRIRYDKKSNKVQKVPLVKQWNDLNSLRRKDELKLSFTNKQANGLAAICGIDNLCFWDFDKCSDENLIKKFLTELGLSDLYQWVIKTGNGFHIWFYLDTNVGLEIAQSESGVQIFQLLNKEIDCSQVELRIKNCLGVLPFSPYPNKGFYHFLFLGEDIPNSKPAIIKIQTVLEVINKFLEPKTQSIVMEKNSELAKSILNGVDEGMRQSSLVKLFGYYFNINPEKEFIYLHLQTWNEKNTPPIDNDELEKQFYYLWNRYSKGLDGVFHQFPSYLLSMPGSPDQKLKKILCYSIKEYNEENRIIEMFKLNEYLDAYHKECKDYCEEYDIISKGKLPIIRVGERLIIEVILKTFSYELFSIYCGIISYLGRGKTPAKRISNDIITYRSCGFKNFGDYYNSNNGIKPPSKYIVRKAVQKLEELNFIRTFKLNQAQMTFYTTKFKSKEKLVDYIVKKELRKIEAQKREENIRQNALDKIADEKRQLNDLKKRNNRLEKECSGSSIFPS